MAQRVHLRVVTHPSVSKKAVIHFVGNDDDSGEREVGVGSLG